MDRLCWILLPLFERTWESQGVFAVSSQVYRLLILQGYYQRQPHGLICSVENVFSLFLPDTANVVLGWSLTIRMGVKKIKVSLEKVAVMVRMWKHLVGFCRVWIAPGLGICKIVAHLVFLHNIRVCLVCWCSVLPALRLSRIQSLFSREGSYFCSLLLTRWNAKFLKARCCNLRISSYSIIWRENGANSECFFD